MKQHDIQGMWETIKKFNKANDKVSDNQVTVACATLGELCQLAFFPWGQNNLKHITEINAINLLNLKLHERDTRSTYQGFVESSLAQRSTPQRCESPNSLTC
jgi:hypothetical protein